MKHILSFSGSSSSYSQKAEHLRNASVARRLDEIGMGRFVKATEPAEEVKEEEYVDENGAVTIKVVPTGKFETCTYYECKYGAFTDEEWDKLRKCGVNPIYHDTVFEPEPKYPFLLKVLTFLDIVTLAGIVWLVTTA